VLSRLGAGIGVATPSSPLEKVSPSWRGRRNVLSQGGMATLKELALSEIFS